jgi:hypothetical protein
MIIEALKYFSYKCQDAGTDLIGWIIENIFRSASKPCVWRESHFFFGRHTAEKPNQRFRCTNKGKLTTKTLKLRISWRSIHHVRPRETL